MNAAIEASNASFASPFEAIGPVNAVIIPTLTTGPDAAADGEDADAVPKGTAIAATSATSTTILIRHDEGPTTCDPRTPTRHFVSMVPPM